MHMSLVVLSVVSVGLAIGAVVHGLDDDGHFEADDKQEILDIHNDYRTALASADGSVTDINGDTYPSGKNMNFLFWDDAVATVAENYAQKLADACSSISHNDDLTDDFYDYANKASFEYPNSDISLGENVGASTTTGTQASLSKYTDRLGNMWREYDDWSYQKYASSNINGAGHFTQMAWADTRYIGCGGAKCYDGSKWYKYYIVCNYYPSGNYLGQYPYEEGTCSTIGCDSDRTATCVDSLCGGCMDPSFTKDGSTDDASDCDNGLGDDLSNINGDGQAMCDDGCSISASYMNDGYCDCSDCEDEDDYSCTSCGRCPDSCGGYVKCQDRTCTQDDGSAGWMCNDGCCIESKYENDNNYCDCAECEDEDNLVCDDCSKGCPSSCGGYSTCQSSNSKEVGTGTGDTGDTGDSRSSVNSGTAGVSDIVIGVLVAVGILLLVVIACCVRVAHNRKRIETLKNETSLANSKEYEPPVDVAIATTVN